jgi:hypothetical protein
LARQQLHPIIARRGLILQGRPEAFIPVQKMGYSVPDARDRADLIAFLASAESK